MATTTVSAAQAPAQCLIEANQTEFRAQFNRRSFEISHQLASHPLFQLQSLLELTQRTLATRPEHAYYDAGKIRVDQRWDQAPKREFSIEDAIKKIETAGAWIILKHAQKDPEYRVLIDGTMAKLKALIGENLEPHIKQEDLIIFITSPNRVSSYHIDRECNFLLQIRGDKTIHVFDQNDREVLTEEELEKFWTVDNNAPAYRPALQNRAKSYLLKPGTGVHIPVNAPHWLQNADNISISLSVNFQFKDSARANVYRANYFLRRAGLRPSPPGGGPIRDSLKNAMMGSAMFVRRLFRGQSPW